jgi:hypothetical protein
MKTQLTVLALAATSLGGLAACTPGENSSSASPTATKVVAADASAGHQPRAKLSVTAQRPVTGVLLVPGAAAPKTPTSSPTPSPSTTTAAKKAKIVSFKLVQKPKCAEGTAVFRAPAVPAIIKWKITGATSAALSVDDATHTAGTYGPEPLTGTETFTFQCNGPVGSTEKHTYAIYTVGGGKQHSLTITAKAKVLDDGKN